WYWANHYIQHVLINLASVAALTWLILRFRKVAGQSLLAVFVVINISTGAGFLFNDRPLAETSKIASAENGSDLPILIHILLDEFGGVRGLENSGSIAQPEIDEMTAEYLANGFSVYPNAFSQFFKSTLSIGHTFNLRQQFGQDILTDIMKSKYFDLSDNAYFSYLRDQGFQLHVYSNEYLNFCNEGKFENVECNKYKYKDLSVLRKFSLSTKVRAVIIGNVYLSFVNYFIWVKELTRLAWNLGDDPDQANVEEDIIGFKPVDFHFPFALGAIAEFNQLKASLETARPGDAYFIHMLLPHYPYVVDTTCQPLPISKWIMLRFSGNAYQGNSRATQDLRYTHYWQQVKCANKLMGELLTRLKTLGLDKNTVLIIHGDHGSRITMIDPLFSEIEKLEARDYLDSFSTFMAVKLPGVQGQIYSESITLVELLSGLAAKNFKALPDLAPLAESPSEVYLGGLISTEYFRVPYPEEPEN
ncbi:MAG: sulfatase-like hydrolase/transferase, partial [Alphaproteobacteria bacterium]